MATKINGVAVAVMAAGALFMYSGVKGKGVITSIQELVTGHSPSAAPAANSLVQPVGVNPVGVNPGGAVPGGGVVPKGATLTRAQIVQLWQQAGGSAASSTNAACHAMQESSGQTKVTSSNPDGGINVGLWQLDTKGVGSGHTVAELQDPMTNARLTVQATRDGADWSQWATPGC